MIAAAREPYAPHVQLVMRVLCCPDCEADLDEDLRRLACRRSFAPEEDGIVSALPSSLQANSGDKEYLRRMIDAEGPATR
jgi:hypothetical protein